MFFEFNRTVIAAALIVVSATPAWSDECTQPTAALMFSAKTPYRETIVSPGPGGKSVTSQIVQTATTKYVERDGRWTSLPVSSSDLVHAFNEMLKTGKMTCKRIGTEQINVQLTTKYTVRIETEGIVTENTLWISAQNRQLKADTKVNGKQFAVTFDYDHVQPPAGVRPVGQR